MDETVAATVQINSFINIDYSSRWQLRKKALERRELEPNFEQKKLNLSIDDNPEYNKENNLEKEERSPKKKKSSYYDKLE